MGLQVIDRGAVGCVGWRDRRAPAVGDGGRAGGVRDGSWRRGGPRPVALVKRARRIHAAARLKAIRPPSGRRARLAAAGLAQ
ncbi:hypothetical protein MSG28_009504 [Choristoneura fumiferana]|uniref:Uncharacterized protein n=1 Tax=Choristoneura fumiferana TaxID=7141 RepID=A0ACC0JBD2_CHOFU|nr:hypothetical protein MSG28_009504 [Choristoneura fumiferana]